jgi:hypothetical protein
MKSIFLSLIMSLLLIYPLFGSSVSQEDLMKLANKDFDVKHFFFYSKEIKKAFLFTQKSNGQFSLYYFKKNG